MGFFLIWYFFWIRIQFFSRADQGSGSTSNWYGSTSLRHQPSVHQSPCFPSEAVIDEVVSLRTCTLLTWPCSAATWSGDRHSPRGPQAGLIRDPACTHDSYTFFILCMILLDKKNGGNSIFRFFKRICFPLSRFYFMSFFSLLKIHVFHSCE